MENKILNGKISVKPEVTAKTKICKCCGKRLPISDFEVYGKGHRSVCRSCRAKENPSSDKFNGFTSRELIEELKHRGYKGELKKVVIEVVRV